MNIELTGSTEKIWLLRFNRIATRLIFLISIIFILGMSFISETPGYEIKFIYNLKVVNSTLAIISIASCWSYYYMHKKNDFFIIALMYLSFAIERFLVNAMFDSIEYEQFAILNASIIPYAMRAILITYTIIEDNKKIDKFLSKKFILASLVCVATWVLIMLDKRSIVNNYKNQNIKLITFVNIIFIIYYFSIIIAWSIKNIKRKDWLYTIFIISMNFFTLRRICVVRFLNIKNINLYNIGNIFTFIGFSVVILGLFIEMDMKMKESEVLKKRLKLFYDITENNQSSGVIICEEGTEIIYTNKLIRHELSKGNGEYRNLEEFIKNYIKDINNTKSNSSEKNAFKDIVFDDNEVRSISVEKMKVGHGNIEVATIIDVTEEYVKNEKLRINEEKLKTINDNIKDLIITIDSEGYITYVNNTVIEILGYTEDEIRKFRYIDLMTITKENYDKNLNCGQGKLWIEHDMKCVKGNNIPVESLISPMINDRGKEIGRIIVARDLSYRKVVENLQKQYEEIKEYDRVKTEFFANLSHEVKTPINVIYSCIQLLESKKSNDSYNFETYYNKYEETMKQNCLRLLKLVNNLLDIVKIDSGFIKMNFGNYDIVNLVEDITLSVVPYVQVKNINIIFDTEVEELIIRCDPEKIERIVLNLLSNAIKFTENDGNILVDLSIDEEWVTIKVKDDGIGIPKELRKIIFERFIQVNSEKSRKKDGSGIGLSLVKSLVELHDGNVFLDDNVEKGSEFVVKLPNKRINEDIEEVKNYEKNQGKLSVEFSDI
ncbi:sensor histidine kinase [Clostridium ihumii]|uniref:sensor histidine kinase n=1 Tax=Clostridium ihumii TaxID=1470356 RepID=UPI000687A446|nr:PAS domain-containing sensor histidine kinase [Clostridium ihumii]